MTSEKIKIENGAGNENDIIGKAVMITDSDGVWAGAGRIYRNGDRCDFECGAVLGADNDDEYDQIVDELNEGYMVGTTRGGYEWVVVE